MRHSSLRRRQRRLSKQKHKLIWERRFTSIAVWDLRGEVAGDWSKACRARWPTSSLSSCSFWSSAEPRRMRISGDAESMPGEVKQRLGSYDLHLQKFWLENQMVRIIPLGELQETWPVIWGGAIFLLFIVCSADLDIHCNECFSQHVKFYSFMIPPGWFVSTVSTLYLLSPMNGLAMERWNITS